MTDKGEQKLKHNPDNREDNVEHIQQNIDATIKNIHLGEEMIEKTSDKESKKNLIEKNKRRQHALTGMRHEIKDEADHRDQH